ncbi:SH3 domain-containing protein [Palleronia marisminoris]|uniref:Bacterial SH3 domain protein n=1 Tax=Palleronia marisminoris TaxID=315423 RepID=A0A1Y5RI31_9RHOB|nr:DUF1236 domain-containing protein [Palleronia marisminoris]SFG22619.1 SH3 domain-containing protein [Palleronia marisminoris]SLN18049.1 Bacterial SH3 domain protein [Palleronia marisminoris]
MSKGFLIAGVSALAFSGAAYAQTAATATTDLNLRAGPGPNYEIVGLIDAEGAVDIQRCVASEAWCEVTYDGTTGWAYSNYLTATVEEEPTVVAESYDTLQIERVERGGLGNIGVGTATGAIAGALLGGPIGAAAGAAAGSAIGGATPTETVTTYVRENPVDPVYLEGEVVVGAGIPEGVEVYTVPEAEYQYAYVNGSPVIIDNERRIVHVVR